MKTREMERALAAADPVGRGRLDGLDFEAMEADLLADVEGEQAALRDQGEGAAEAKTHPAHRENFFDAR